MLTRNVRRPLKAIVVDLFCDFELWSVFLKLPIFKKEEMNLFTFIPHIWITYRSHLELNINTVHQCRPCSLWRMSHLSHLQTLNVRL